MKNSKFSIGQKVGVDGMGLMGLETYYGSVVEIIDHEVVRVDFKVADVTCPRFLNIHVSSIVE